MQQKTAVPVNRQHMRMGLWNEVICVCVCVPENQLKFMALQCNLFSQGEREASPSAGGRRRGSYITLTPGSCTMKQVQHIQAIFRCSGITKPNKEDCAKMLVVNSVSQLRSYDSGAGGIRRLNTFFFFQAGWKATQYDSSWHSFSHSRSPTTSVHPFSTPAQSNSG